MPATIGVDCPHCGQSKITCEISGHLLEEPAYRESLGRPCYLTGFCRGCRHPIGIRISPKNVNNKIRFTLERGGDITEESNITQIWPEVKKPKAPDFVPDNVASAFLEAERCRLRGDFGSAAMSYRKALERSVNKIHPNGGANALVKTLHELATEGRITTDIADWAKEIRILGNAGAHEEEDPTQEEVADQANLTAMALAYLFEMPERVRLMRERRAE